MGVGGYWQVTLENAQATYCIVTLLLGGFPPQKKQMQKSQPPTGLEIISAAQSLVASPQFSA